MKVLKAYRTSSRHIILKYYMCRGIKIVKAMKKNNNVTYKG